MWPNLQYLKAAALPPAHNETRPGHPTRCPSKYQKLANPGTDSNPDLGTEEEEPIQKPEVSEEHLQLQSK